MKAVITSIGESTTELAIWALARNGFDVVVYKSSSSLWDKLKSCYGDLDEDFIRVDADVVVNANCNPENVTKLYVEEYAQSGTAVPCWVQYKTYDWYKQDITHGGVQLIKKEALPVLRLHIQEARYLERPESYMFRLGEFHNPRRCLTQDVIMGLNGYAANDLERVKATKQRREQYENYDWELHERLSKLEKN
jgi:hypothetical protein